MSEAPKQVPSVGRVVHFHIGHVGKLRTRPAMIVHYWPPANHPGYTKDEVNLQVFLDGTNDTGQPFAPADGWATSVARSDEPKAGCWSWPTHVPAKP